MSTTVPAAPSTSGVSITVGGHSFGNWTDATVDRDLRNIAGQFTLSYYDAGRAAAAVMPDLDQRPPFEVIKPGLKCAVALDGTVVLTGYIDTVNVAWKSGALTAQITGRDAVGDMVDCAASPNGPVEWRNLNLLQLASAIAKPFGIAVRADVDIGAAFPVFGIEIGETAMLAIERAARQRAVLVVSDGVGGLLLTRGGASRACGALTMPGNVQDAQYSSSWLQRFSDYYVKGQTNPALARAGRKAGLTSATNPTSAPGVAPAVSATVAEAANVQMTGHVTDPAITRYRPTVRGVRTQSGGATVQAQADWALRVARGMSETAHYTVLGWGVGSTLWLPNALTRVSDPYAGINRDMLISSVGYRQTSNAVMTVLGIAGRTAFDRIDEPAQDSRYIFHKAPKSFGPTRTG